MQSEEFFAGLSPKELDEQNEHNSVFSKQMDYQEPDPETTMITKLISESALFGPRLTTLSNIRVSRPQPPIVYENLKVSVKDVFTKRCLTISIPMNRTCECRGNPGEDVKDYTCQVCNGAGFTGTAPPFFSPYYKRKTPCLFCNETGQCVPEDMICELCSNKGVKSTICKVDVPLEKFNGNFKSLFVLENVGNSPTKPSEFQGDVHLNMVLNRHPYWELVGTEFIFARKQLPLIDVLSGKPWALSVLDEKPIKCYIDSIPKPGELLINVELRIFLEIEYLFPTEFLSSDMISDRVEPREDMFRFSVAKPDTVRYKTKVFGNQTTSMVLPYSPLED